MNTCFRGSRFLLSLALCVSISAVLAGCKSGGGGSTSNSTATAATTTTGSIGTTTTSTTSAPATTSSSDESPATVLDAPVTSSTPNSAPKLTAAVISSVTAGSLYSFAPAASDAEGDQLTFQIQNKPTWATFSTVNGKLVGTPQTEQVGTYGNIVVSASDGKISTSLPPFSITVAKPNSGTATLAWTPPTHNVDGSELTGLAGFTIVYGKAEAQLDQTVRIDNADVSEYLVQSLAPGTYYFAVKAISADGAESGLSEIVSKTIS